MASGHLRAILQHNGIAPVFIRQQIQQETIDPLPAPTEKTGYSTFVCAVKCSMMSELSTVPAVGRPSVSRMAIKGRPGSVDASSSFSQRRGNIRPSARLQRPDEGIGLRERMSDGKTQWEQKEIWSLNVSKLNRSCRPVSAPAAQARLEIVQLRLPDTFGAILNQENILGQNRQRFGAATADANGEIGVLRFVAGRKTPHPA